IRGPTLNFIKISRICEGTYQCHASNGIGENAVRQTTVKVHFRPEIHLPTLRIGQTLGRHTILECTVTASPIGLTVWQRNRSTLSNDGKTEIELYNEKLHTITLSLRIKNLSRTDYGYYNCVAQNILGSENKTVELFG
ncbi:hypothetical protein HELRODRAFT_71271, partial [Helobdella robusta]|uniref:Ig-like domain-containing protein n=1 Tax=Helobdella robusta TaxID=6412 RepID=T1G0I7_HELRO